MLGIKSGLLRHVLRPVLPVTLVELPPACLYVLFRQDVLEWRCGYAAAFILFHTLALTSLQGRFGTGGFAFLYTRGYSRDALWAHTMLASFLSVLAVWAAAAAIVWTPLRSMVQGHLFRSPYFPVMAPQEATVPLAWLVGYCILIPLSHYAWIRHAQPTRGGLGGTFIAAGVTVALVVLTLEGLYRPWFTWLAAGAGTVTVCVMLIGSRRLHRRLEVQA